MADKLFLELVSPEKLLVSSDVDNVFAAGAGGAFGLYPDHSPFCTALVPCVLTYAIGQETYKVIVSKGFLEVADNKVNVLAEKAVFVKDIDKAISNTTNWKAFDLYLKNLGYSYTRNSDYRHPSIIAPGWKRSVRLDSLDKRYTQEKIRQRMIDNQKNITLYAIRIPKRYAPLLQLEYEFKKAQRMDGMQLAFALIIELWKLITGNNIEPSSPKPLSPALRQEVRKLDQTLKEYKLLCENQIDSAQKLVSFIEKKSTDISALESERQKIYNRIRRPKSEVEKEQNKAVAREISAKLKPLREDLKTARSITERYPHILKLLETERAMEIQVKTKNRERNYER